jgi:hypothetical protein
MSQSQQGGSLGLTITPHFSVMEALQAPSESSVGLFLLCPSSCHRTIWEQMPVGFAHGRNVCSLEPSELWQSPGAQHQHPQNPFPRGWDCSWTCAHYRPLTCLRSCSWFMPIALAFHQPGCVTLWSDPRRLRRTKHVPVEPWLSHLHPDKCVFVSTHLSHLQITFTSLAKVFIWHFKVYTIFK